MATNKTDRLNRGIVGGIISTFIGFAGYTHWESIPAGLLCFGIIIAMVYIEARFVNPL